MLAAVLPFLFHCLIVILFVLNSNSSVCCNSKNVARSTGVTSNLWPCECCCFSIFIPSICSFRRDSCTVVVVGGAFLCTFPIHQRLYSSIAFIYPPSLQPTHTFIRHIIFRCSFLCLTFCSCVCVRAVCFACYVFYLHCCPDSEYIYRTTMHIVCI